MSKAKKLKKTATDAADHYSDSIFVEKYRHIYEYSKNCYMDELSRYQTLEAKIGRYINLLSILIAGFSILVGSFLSELESALFCLSVFILFFVALTYITLLFSLVSIWKSLKFNEMPRMPFSDEFIQYAEIDKNNLSTLFIDYAHNAKEAISKARSVNELKVSDAKLGYQALAISCGFLIVTAILMFVYAVLKSI